jgi:acyl-CoA dehydrogenase
MSSKEQALFSVTHPQTERKMDFSLNDEQKMMIETVRRFISEELQPLEDEVEDKGYLDHAHAETIYKKSKELGLYGMNMPIELGGGGLSN